MRSAVVQETVPPKVLELNPVRCFYLNNLDGQAAAALVYLAHPNCEFIPLDYDAPLPTEPLPPRGTIYLIGLHFNDATMAHLMRRSRMVWIDRRLTAIQRPALTQLALDGNRAINRALCELTWEYFHPGTVPPAAIHYIGNWRRLDRTDPNTARFVFGMKVQDPHPTNVELWGHLYNNTFGKAQLIIEDGSKFQTFIDREYADYARSTAFETELDGFKLIACNRGMHSQLILDALFDASKYDAAATFFFRQNLWRVAIYTTRDDIDLTVLAQKYGGQGNPNAIGFNIDVLPFKLPGTEAQA
jgi:hypothetical protein